MRAVVMSLLHNIERTQSNLGQAGVIFLDMLVSVLI